MRLRFSKSILYSLTGAVAGGGAALVDIGRHTWIGLALIAVSVFDFAHLTLTDLLEKHGERRP
jgi:hypothetical protein